MRPEVRLAATPLLALAGTGVATYLTVIHYRRDLLVCTTGGCETVQQSRYAEIGPIPIAILGLGMYLAILALAALRWRRPDLAETATAGAFAIALAGSLYALYLTYVEVAVLHAICQWCVASAILTWLILLAEGTAVARLWAGDGGIEEEA